MKTKLVKELNRRIIAKENAQNEELRSAVKEVDKIKKELNGKTFNVTFSEQELNALAEILHVATKAAGLEGNIAVNSVHFVKKIQAGEVK